MGNGHLLQMKMGTFRRKRVSVNMKEALIGGKWGKGHLSKYNGQFSHVKRDTSYSVKKGALLGT